MAILNVIANNFVYFFVNLFIIVKNFLLDISGKIAKLFGINTLDAQTRGTLVIIVLVVLVAFILTLVILILRRRNAVDIYIDINEKTIDKVKVYISSNIEKNIRTIKEKSMYDFEKLSEFIDAETFDVDEKKFSILITDIDAALTAFKKTNKK